MTYLSGAMLMLLSFNAYSEQWMDRIAQKHWIHGAAECSSNQDPKIDLLAVDDDTYILRQNKCTHYEAPFIYLLFGQHTLLVQDTGATKEADQFPLYQTIKQLVEQRQKKMGIAKIDILVTHSHSHSDHIAGDVQFEGQPNVTLVKPDSAAIKSFYKLEQWPTGQGRIDLGDREVTVLPIPGHHKDAIALHDSKLNLLLTGDSFYPGRLYVKSWTLFKQSTARLLAYAEQHKIDVFLGTHIEMSNEAGKDYPMGSQYQPNEASLLLSLSDLRQLHEALELQGDIPERITMEKMIVYPTP